MTSPKNDSGQKKETGTFNQIGTSDKRMFGAVALLVSGYSEAEQTQLTSLLSEVFPDGVPAVFVDDALKHLTLAELASYPRPDDAAGGASSLPRAIIMSGLSENELHGVMKAYREAELPRQIWASVTPVSSKWTLQHLLEELHKEKDDLRKAMAAKRARETEQRD